MKVYCDQGVDQKILKQLMLEYPLEVVSVNHYEEPVKLATAVPGVFMLDKSRLDSGDYLADAGIKPLEKLLNKGKPSDRYDVTHLYSAYHADCKYFITNNPKDFIREVRNDSSSNGKREKLEEMLKGMKILELQEFISKKPWA